MAQLDYSIGQARTPLNIQPGIQNYFTGQANRRANIASEATQKAAKKTQTIADMVSRNTDETGKLNRENLKKDGLKKGMLGEVTKWTSDWAKQDKAIFNANVAKEKRESEILGRISEGVLFAEKDYESQARAQESALFNMQKAGIQIPKVFREGELGPAQQQAWNTIFTKLGSKDAKARLSGKALSAKDALKEKRTLALEAKSEEFRTKLLPTLNIENLATDKNARNLLVKQINESEYWNTPLAKQVMKELKGKSTNILEQMGKLLKTQNLAETKLTGEEKKALGGLAPAIEDMNRLTDMYKAGSTGGVASTLESFASGIPFVGQRAFKKAAEFNKHKTGMAERFLRIATGAAAPDAEVAKYEGFLPNWGDTPAQAQVAIESFMSNVTSKAQAAVSRLLIQGTPEARQKAETIKANIEDMLEQIKPINEPKIGKWKKVN